MNGQTLTATLSQQFGLSETELIYKGILAFIQKEMRLAEHAINAIRERYDVLSPEELYAAIQEGRITGHPSWEDYILWKNKAEHIRALREVIKGLRHVGDISIPQPDRAARV